MIKTYIAKTILSMTVRVNGSPLRVSFDARTVKGSTYTTSDEAVQAAIEAHPKFGKTFKLAPQPKPVVKVVEQKPTIRKISVDSLADAKEILADKVGVSRTKLRSKADIEKVAAANGIEFVWK